MPGPSRILAHVYRPDGSLYGTAELAVAEDGLTFADVPVCAEPLQGHYREVRRAVELMGHSHEVRTASGFVVRRVRDRTHHAPGGRVESLPAPLGDPR